VAAAFDSLADSLEQRIHERKLAEEKLRKLNEELERRVAERTRELDEKNQTMQDDLDLAREFQTSMLPEKRGHFPSGTDLGNALLRFHHQYQASGGVGGDFYEVIEISDHQAGIFLCDVMGNRRSAHLPGRYAAGVHRWLV